MDILTGSLKMLNSIFVEFHFQWKKQGDQNKCNKGYKLNTAVSHNIIPTAGTPVNVMKTTAQPAHLQHL